MDTNLIIQYFLVGAILVATVVWVIYKAVKNRGNNSAGCCGCALSEKCSSNNNKDKKAAKNPDGKSDCFGK